MIHTVFDKQRHKPEPSDPYRAEQTHVRYQTSAGAEKVAKILRKITSGMRIYVRHDPVDKKERERGVGDYTITTFRHLDCFATSRFWGAIEQAQTLVLADEVAKHNERHPLLREWAIKSENRDKLHTIRFEDKDFTN